MTTDFEAEITRWNLQGISIRLRWEDCRFDQYGRIPFAVVSGSTKESVIAARGSLKLLYPFETFVYAGNYQKSKPDPEPFLIVAERLKWHRNPVSSLKIWT